MPKGKVPKRRTAAEMAAHRAQLKPRKCSCGHTAVAAADYYNSPSHVIMGDACIDCYRETERERQRARRVGDAVPALKRAGHAKSKRRPLTKQQQVALDILRDARAKPKTMGWVYLVVEGHYGPQGLNGAAVGKVGWTSKNPPEARLNDYQAGNPRKLVMIGKIRGTKRKESNIHKRHIDKNVLGEWFRLDDALLSEFGLKKEDLA
jgi:hypothetical protein